MAAVADLMPAARRTGALLDGIPDDLLDAPTPCADYSLGDLLDHLGGLALAFRAAATKKPVAGAPSAPTADASQLRDDWRTQIPRDLVALAEAWREPDAWTGMTAAGGVDLPGETAGRIALNEVLIHGWDVARTIGQPYDADEASLAAAHEFLAPLAESGESTPGLFERPVAVPADAPLLDRVIGLTGRDPNWSPG
jgi:uncharacterized protein (TIGR03086 family)